MKNFFNDLKTPDWKADVISGLLVFLIALPLCLGIALASQFPPISGILTAVVGGVLAGFMGSARLTIKGPAAGLIVICLGAVTELGQGDLALGHKRAIATICVAAGIQVIFAFMRMGRFANVIPPSAVHGMLAAIGVIIAAKQVHVLLGYAPVAKKPFALLAEIPNAIMNLTPGVAAIGLACLAVVFLWPKLLPKFSKKVPGQLVALLLGITAAWFAKTDAKFLVTLPGSITSSLVSPDWSYLGNWSSIKYIIMFALVGSIESLLTVNAVNSLDPEKKPSNMDKDLFATGIANLVAGLFGGLPMISEIVRSRANLDNGARSPWANISHGIFLALFVGLFPSVLGMIPMSALAAMLIYTGFRLASPTEFTHALELGKDQLAVFMTTLLVTLGVDLLAGVMAGVALEFALDVYRNHGFKGMFKATYEVAKKQGKSVFVHVTGPMTFTNLLDFEQHLYKATHDTNEVRTDVHVDVADTTLVDHTVQARLEELGVHLEGTEKLDSASAHKHSTKVKREGHGEQAAETPKKVA